MARLNINISKRVVIWLFLITGIAFILQLSESRYDNIDPHGLNYHLIENSHLCPFIGVCKLNRDSNGINLSVKLSPVAPTGSYILNLESTQKITRATLRFITTNNQAQFKPGVASNAVKGLALSKSSIGDWRSRVIRIGQDQKKIRTILYLFTENAIYEVRLNFISNRD